MVAYLAQLTAGNPLRERAVAVDGKTSRGARRADGTRVHLLGVAEHGGRLLDHLAWHVFLGLTSGAVVLTWLYNRCGGSILLVIVWHGLYNFVSGTQAATGLLAAVVSTLVMIQGVVLIVLELRARRRGRPSVLGPA